MRTLRFTGRSVSVKPAKPYALRVFLYHLFEMLIKIIVLNEDIEIHWTFC